MKWDSSGVKFDLSLHLENLIPGAATLAALAKAVPAESVTNDGKGWGSLENLLANPVASAIVFVSVVYLLGVTAHIASRFVIDTLSRWSLRWILLRYLAGGDLKQQGYDESTARKPKPDRILEIYEATLREALKSEKSEVKTEVGRRRERGRLLRSSAVPAAIWLVPNYLGIGGLVLVMTAIYAYAEVMVFQEACLGVEPKPA